jgi:hypothetical protein
MLSELTADVLDNPTPRALKVIKEAEAQGWTIGKISLRISMTKPADEMAVPLYAAWDCSGRTREGKVSWHFSSAATANLMELSEDDLITYLKDPSVIWADFEAIREAGGCDFLGCRPSPKRNPRPETLPKIYEGQGQYCDKHAKVAIPAAMLAKLTGIPVTQQKEEATA